jgi:hypothetical protein
VRLAVRIAVLADQHDAAIGQDGHDGDGVADLEHVILTLCSIREPHDVAPQSAPRRVVDALAARDTKGRERFGIVGNLRLGRPALLVRHCAPFALY